MTKERLQKLISQSGYCSRREAEILIKNQKVKINGKIATLGGKADFEQDTIEINGKKICFKKLVYYIMNKPKNVICSTKKQDDREIIINLIETNKKIFPVGRLDYDTTGTILLTNDGILAHRLTHPKFLIERTYLVTLNEDLNKKDLDLLNSDQIILEGKKSLQKVIKIENKLYKVVLTRGIYHHVKRLFSLVGKEVIELDRIKFGPISYDPTIKKRGEYRLLTNDEISLLKKMVNLK